MLLQIKQKLMVQVHLHYQATLDGFSDVTITTTTNAANAEPQTKESIRYNAPLQYTAKTEQLLLKIMKQLSNQFMQMLNQ